MPKNPESRTSTQGVKATVSSTKRTNLDKLSKSQLIELLSGNIKNPITPEELYRCAVSVLGKCAMMSLKATTHRCTNSLQSSML